MAYECVSPKSRWIASPSLTKSLISLEMSPMQKFKLCWFLNLLKWNYSHSFGAKDSFKPENVYVGLCLSGVCGNRKLGEAKSNILPQTTLMSNVPSLQYHYDLFSFSPNYLSILIYLPPTPYSDYPCWCRCRRKNGDLLSFAFSDDCWPQKVQLMEELARYQGSWLCLPSTAAGFTTFNVHEPFLSVI